MADRIGPPQFHAAPGSGDWRVLGDGACAFFRTGSFAAGARLAQAVGELPGLGEHRPDVDIRHDGVTVRLVTMTADHFGLSRADVELARQISAVARGLGATADPAAVQTVQVTIDALAPGDVLPFWRALLGYGARGGSTEDLVDPGRTVPVGVGRPGRQRSLHRHALTRAPLPHHHGYRLLPAL